MSDLEADLSKVAHLLRRLAEKVLVGDDLRDFMLAADALAADDIPVAVAEVAAGVEAVAEQPAPPVVPAPDPTPAPAAPIAESDAFGG